jgi:hypothetical protein
MKKTFYITILSLLFFSISGVAQNQLKDKFVLNALGFEGDYCIPNFYVLKLDITNKSKDTLYISEKNIQVIVIKQGGVLLEDRMDEEAPYFILRNTMKFKCEEKDNYDKKINELKLNFANKLYEKNFGSSETYKKDRDFIVHIIVRDCIVLMPNESIDYNTGFNSKAFDKTCIVKAEYIDRKTFTYFMNDNEKTEVNN